MVRNNLAVCLLIGAVSAWAQARYAGGTGRLDDPYRIAGAQDLRRIAENEADWSKAFLLVADIDLTDDPDGAFPPIGTDEFGHRFTGVFDGNGHAIRGLILASDALGRVGLFAGVAGTVKNLRLVDVVVDAPGADWVGALVGSLRYGTLKNCTVEGGRVSGRNNVGGLVGWSDHGNLYHCSATCDVFGQNEVGGLLGDGEVTKLVACFATGDVTATGDDVGGLMGSNYGGLLSACHAHGAVVGRFYTGGLVGGNYLGFIGDAYAVGAVQGEERVGGLVGDNAPWGVIVNAFAVGRVTGVRHVGGLVGTNNNPCRGATPYGTIVDCYWDVQASGLATMCGDEQRDCDDSRGRTTAELQRRETFRNWDFTSTWAISEKQTYPYFRTQLTGDLNNDDRVDLCDLSVLGGQWLKGLGDDLDP